MKCIGVIFEVYFHTNFIDCSLLQTTLCEGFEERPQSKNDKKQEKTPLKQVSIRAGMMYFSPIQIRAVSQNNIIKFGTL